MVNRHYAIITQEYKLIHYYFVEDSWELIDRVKDPMELKNVYDDPAYLEIREDLHQRLEELRVKYQDNSTISQQYIDRLLEDARGGNVWGVDEMKVSQIEKRKAAIE